MGMPHYETGHTLDWMPLIECLASFLKPGPCAAQRAGLLLRHGGVGGAAARTHTTDVVGLARLGRFESL
jgi:hypothetical protein